jgi:hypothetical protein
MILTDDDEGVRHGFRGAEDVGEEQSCGKDDLQKHYGLF